MEDKEVHDVFYFLTERRRPLSMEGKKNQVMQVSEILQYANSNKNQQ